MEERLTRFNGNILKRDGINLRTKEGPNAVIEAIDFLKIQKPVGQLEMDGNLTQAANDHAVDSDKHNIVGHVSSDGSTMSDRINRYYSVRAARAENIDYGTKSA